MTSRKKLIINADDYGASPEVNQAIEQLISAERLGGVSVLANGHCWEQAVAFLTSHSQISAGIHLNWIEGHPVAAHNAVKILTNPQGKFFGRNQLMKRWALHPKAISQAIEIEARAQIERLFQAGLELSHADSHQHLHAFPPIFSIVVTLCEEYKIPALRWPQERTANPARALATLFLNTSLKVSRVFTSAKNLFCNDHFLGFKRAGEYNLATLLADTYQLPDGVTELCVHPSMADGIPYPNLRGNIEREALLSEEFRAHLIAQKIQLMNWEQVNG